MLLFSGAKGVPSLPLETPPDDGPIVLEGESGGRTYLTLPVRDLKRDGATLVTLLHDVDALRLNEPEYTRIWYKPAPTSRHGHFQVRWALWLSAAFGSVPGSRQVEEKRPS